VLLVYCPLEWVTALRVTSRTHGPGRAWYQISCRISFGRRENLEDMQEGMMGQDTFGAEDSRSECCPHGSINK
jgi:hypothetical protein